jgi:hypothetical protein
MITEKLNILVAVDDSFSQILNVGGWEGNHKSDYKETVCVVPTGSGCCPVECCRENGIEH